jgi:hypothetical protein
MDPTTHRTRKIESGREAIVGIDEADPDVDGRTLPFSD